MRNFIVILIIFLFSNNCYAGITTNGTDNYLSGTTNLGLNAGTEMSVCSWFGNAGAGSDGIIIAKVTDPTAGFSTFFLEADNTIPAIGFAIANKASSKFPYMEATTVISGGPHFACATWKRNAGTSADFAIYLDGVSKTIDSYTANGYDNTYSLEETSGDLSLGARKYNTPDTYFPGNFGDVAVWSKQLTSAEVTTLYNGGYSRPCQRLPTTVEPANLVFYAPLDDILSGSVSSSPGNYGTTSVSFGNFVNSPQWTASLNCCDTQLNNAKINNATINGGTCQ